MGLFQKLDAPVFRKEDSEAQRQLQVLEALHAEAAAHAGIDGVDIAALEQEIRLVKMGIAGEARVHYELENSHIPMYVLHDLFLEYDGLTAQIDYLIITQKHQFVLECKNLFGNIEINAAGDFIRTLGSGSHAKREGIYSPITQNQRHLELIRAMRSAEKSVFTRAIFEKNFAERYRSLVVLTNPKTILSAAHAADSVRAQVIRADQLVAYIRRVDAEGIGKMSAKDMAELADFFLAANRPPKIDYTEKFRAMLAEHAAEADTYASASACEAPSPSAEVLCPRCGAPMVLRKSNKPEHANKPPFYGCSRFPQCRGIRKIP